MTGLKDDVRGRLDTSVLLWNRHLITQGHVWSCWKLSDYHTWVRGSVENFFLWVHNAYIKSQNTGDVDCKHLLHDKVRAKINLQKKGHQVSSNSCSIKAFWKYQSFDFQGTLPFYWYTINKPQQDKARSVFKKEPLSWCSTPTAVWAKGT